MARPRTDQSGASPPPAAGPRTDVTGRPVEPRRVDLDTFFSPSTVAVVGASDAPGRPTTAMWRKISVWADHAGARIFPVNPGRATVDGHACLDSILEVPGDLDLAVILVGDAVAMFEEALEKRPRFAVIFGAGFAESGIEGEQLQRQLEDLVESGETHLLGPNTNLNAFEIFRDDLPPPKVALITQSGHQGRPLFQAQTLGLALSHWAPTGNEVDLELADFVTRFADRDEIGAIAAYVEGFKDGRTLMLAADHAAKAGVPIVMVKVGRTDEGRSMARSHTGHLTGNDRVTDAVFEQFGVIRVDGLDELQETAMMLTRSAPPTAPGVAVYSISGGTGAHVADLCAAAGLQLPALSPETQEALRQWIPGYLRVSNPVDCGGAPAMDERGRKILRAIVDDPAVGVLLCPITGALEAMSAPLARDLVATAAETDKPVCVVWGSPLADDPAYTEVLVPSGLPVFRSVRNAVVAISAQLDHHAFLGRYASPFAKPVLRRSRAASAVAPALATPGPLSEHASKDVLAAYGIEVTREQLCQSASEAARAAQEVGLPCVMKVSSPDIAHKSELGLVRVGVDSGAAVRRSYVELMRMAADLAPRARVEGVVVSELILNGVETIVGVTHDELFGPVVAVGLGGILVEVLDDMAVRVPPFGRSEARRMIESLGGVDLLRGVRGQPPVSVGRLIDTIMRVQRLAVDHAEALVELDINPLVVTSDRAVAVDALIVAGPARAPHASQEEPQS